ncbi:MAG: ABC transporter [Deltaproteobacteria bacterium]|nr:ABC transporter [Deltaproteobacteria bacterium]
MTWFTIFLKDMLLFQRRLLRLGYVISTLFAPLLYLGAFGLGLGKRVVISGGSYLDFLLPGLVAMSSMTNSYTWVANSLNMGRLYFRTFQIYLQAPVSAGAIVAGQVAAGMVRGLFASLIILVLGLALGRRMQFNLMFALGMLANGLVFSAFGVVVGLKSRSHEDTATFTNFFILPMAFFCGTFFPVDELPWGLRGLIRTLPLTHTNELLRHPEMNRDNLVSLLILMGYGLLCVVLGIIFIRRYSE